MKFDYARDEYSIAIINSLLYDEEILLIIYHIIK